MPTTTPHPSSSDRPPRSLRASDPAEALVADVRQQISDGHLKPGTRIESIRELANRYDIAFVTARLAVGRLEKLGLVQRRQGSGTYVCDRPSQTRTPVARRTRTVGLMVPVNDHLYDRFAASLEEKLLAEGCLVSVLAQRPPSSPAQLEVILQTLRDDPPSSLVLQMHGLPGMDEAIEKTLAGRTNVITVFRPSISVRGKMTWHSVRPDFDAAMCMAAELLVAQGHKTLGMLTFKRVAGPSKPDHFWKRTTEHTPDLISFGRAIRRLGLKQALRIGYMPPAAASWGSPVWPDAIAAVVRILDTADRPTALFGQDWRLVAAIHAARQLGLRVPEDLTLLGIGQTPWSEAFSFPSIGLRPEIIADHVARLILHADEPRASVPCSILVAPEAPTNTGPTLGSKR